MVFFNLPDQRVAWESKMELEPRQRFTPDASPVVLQKDDSTLFNQAVMKTLKTPVVAFLLLAFGSLLGGCSMNTKRDSAIPWSRPANWEGQIPGMGNMPGGGR